ncbi:MAG TPA: hypothetical protein VJS30_16265 [Paraburkholderia sp.]|nr:hypothetical protein [Paraburkholderia sp.]
MANNSNGKPTFTVSTDLINDATHVDNNDVLEEIVSAARATLAAGGHVVLNQEYENAPPDTVAVFRTSADFEKWVTDQNAMRTELGKPTLGNR